MAHLATLAVLLAAAALSGCLGAADEPPQPLAATALDQPGRTPGPLDLPKVEILVEAPRLAHLDDGTGGNYAVHTGDTIRLDASSSIEPGGAPLSFGWTLNADDVRDGPRTQIVYDEPGSYHVLLKVRNTETHAVAGKLLTFVVNGHAGPPAPVMVTGSLTGACPQPWICGDDPDRAAARAYRFTLDAPVREIHLNAAFDATTVQPQACLEAPDRTTHCADTDAIVMVDGTSVALGGPGEAFTDPAFVGQDGTWVLWIRAEAAVDGDFAAQVRFF